MHPGRAALLAALAKCVWNNFSAACWWADLLGCTSNSGDLTCNVYEYLVTKTCCERVRLLSSGKHPRLAAVIYL